MTGPFLRAAWRQLAVLNYAVERSLLTSLVPRGTELDDWRGRTCVSVVGFLFLDSRVLGVPIPFHGRFEEVNLRFYVRRKSGDEWRRGVVFVKELVPKAAVTLVARALYNENYVTLPMAHEIQRSGDESERVTSASYRWTLDGRPNHVSVAVEGPLQPLVAGSEEEFITEHYWGYTRQRDGGTSEYNVRHPRWRVATAARAELDCDVSRLYGPAFVEPLRARPVSAFLADGSEVTVSRGVRVAS
jgi:uncharacterized protein YqjF (DUF2071 family)